MSETALYELLSLLRLDVRDARETGGHPSSNRGDATETAQAQGSACAVCRLSTRSVTRWLRAFLDEYVNDPAARETIRRAQGFCALHTRLLEETGDSLAVAILYGDLARLTCERWERNSQKPNLQKVTLMGRLMSNGLANRWGQAERQPCPACIAYHEGEGRFVQALATGMEQPEVQETVYGNGGLCVPHIQQVVDAATPSIGRELIERESARLNSLRTELGEIVRKNDYRFRGEPWGPEKDAWRRALDKLKR